MIQQSNALKINPLTTRMQRARRQLGVGMLDAGLYVVLGVLVAAGLVAAYQKNKSSISAGDLGEKITLMASDIQKNWNTAGSYATVSPAEVNKLQAIRPPMRYNGTTLTDAWGNTMTLNGGATSFALTIGGSASPIAKDECADVVSRVASVATSVRIGADAAAAAGVISGGAVYKNGATITQAGLTDGCNASNPIIAVQYR